MTNKIPLPPISDIFPDETNVSPDALSECLAILFEPSPVLYSHLAPQLAASADRARTTTYSDLVDASITTIQSWDRDLQAQFIAGHPRIGEVSGLSKLSQAEQAAKATSPIVLKRLTHLNACYEHAYPGLRYITFVNGRSREVILEEMETRLGVEHSSTVDQPPVVEIAVIARNSPEWMGELDRAVMDVGRIAKSRARSMGAV
jgi:2-oxo-4-hydroxy-4-carboxy--5-ureidoimidazoline (OHCU) decarboxylase